MKGDLTNRMTNVPVQENSLSEREKKKSAEKAEGATSPFLTNRYNGRGGMVISHWGVKEGKDGEGGGFLRGSFCRGGRRG